jgi:hypothetical protein
MFEEFHLLQTVAGLVFKSHFYGNGSGMMVEIMIRFLKKKLPIFVSIQPINALVLQIQPPLILLYEALLGLVEKWVLVLRWHHQYRI